MSLFALVAHIHIRTNGSPYTRNNCPNDFINEKCIWLRFKSRLGRSEHGAANTDDLLRFMVQVNLCDSLAPSSSLVVVFIVTNAMKMYTCGIQNSTVVLSLGHLRK